MFSLLLRYDRFHVLLLDFQIRLVHAPLQTLRAQTSQNVLVRRRSGHRRSLGIPRAFRDTERCQIARYRTFQMPRGEDILLSFGFRGFLAFPPPGGLVLVCSHLDRDPVVLVLTRGRTGYLETVSGCGFAGTLLSRLLNVLFYPSHNIET